MDKITQDFLKFEKERSLFKREYCGVPYWQGIRLRIGWAIIGIIDTGEAVTNIVTSKWKKRITLCFDFFKDFYYYYHLKKCDILYFDQGMEVVCRNIDGELKDVYFGYFGYEEKYLVERCYYDNEKKRNLEKSGIGMGLLFPYKVKSKIQFLFNPQDKIDEDEEKFIRSLCEEISNKYGKKVSSDIIIQIVRWNCEIYKIYQKYYQKILKKTAPKAIFLQCHYGEILYPLYKIAKELSVPVIELQHGHISNHLAYKYLDVSNKGKELPDYLFTYGDFWNEQIQMPMRTRIVSIGNPFLEAMKEQYKNKVPNEKGIVFYPGYFFQDGKELEKLAVEFYRKYKEEGYKVYFKFHPGEMSTWRDNYHLLADCKGIEIIEPNMNVYRLFSLAKHHVSVASTVLYEAVNFNVGRYVYDFEGIKEVMKEICTPLIEQGYAQRFSAIWELEELINRKAPVEGDLVDKMWKSRAKENGQKALKEIIENNNQRGR